MLRTGLFAFGVALGLAFAMWARRGTTTVIVIPQPAPVPVEVAHAAPPSPPPEQPAQPQPPQPPPPQPPPPQPPADPDPLGPCLAPFTGSTAGELHAPADTDTITLSRHDARLIAAWSSDTLHISTNDGDSFERVLQRDGAIGDVAFDCRGRLHVIRGTGELGTYDPHTKIERWTRVATFWSRGDTVDTGRLIPDGVGVAVIGNTPARRDRLWLFRRGGDGRWRAKHLFSDSEPGYWSGIRVGTIRPLPDGRIRMMATPNMADYGAAECGYSKVFEVTFDLDARRIAARDQGEGEDYLDDRIQQDPAGRWVLSVDGRVSRLSTRALVEQLEKAAPAPASTPTPAPAPAP